jgi:uncharacterized membrane protein (DUF106 family)
MPGNKMFERIEKQMKELQKRLDNLEKRQDKTFDSERPGKPEKQQKKIPLSLDKENEQSA